MNNMGLQNNLLGPDAQRVLRLQNKPGMVLGACFQTERVRSMSRTQGQQSNKAWAKARPAEKKRTMQGAISDTLHTLFT